MLNVGLVYLNIRAHELIRRVCLWPGANHLLSQPSLQMKIPMPVAVSITFVALAKNPLHRHNIEQSRTYQALWMIGRHTPCHTCAPIVTYYEKAFTKTDLRHQGQHILAHRTLIVAAGI